MYSCVQLVPAPAMMSQCEWPSSLLDWQNRQKRERHRITQPSGLQLLAGSPEYSGWDERLLLRMHQDKWWNTICWRWREAWSVSSGFSLAKRRDERVCGGRSVSVANTKCEICVFRRVILSEETNTWCRQALWKLSMLSHNPGWLKWGQLSPFDIQPHVLVKGQVHLQVFMGGFFSYF